MRTSCRRPRKNLSREPRATHADIRSHAPCDSSRWEAETFRFPAPGCRSSRAPERGRDGTLRGAARGAIEPAVTMPTDAARRATELLRDGRHFQWHVIPLLLLVLYVYANEIERRNWNVVFAGLALWGADWLNEIANALFFHATGHAPVWSTPSGSAYVLLVGLNVEISLMFAVMGVVVAKTLPADPALRILGLPNRWLVALAFWVHDLPTVRQKVQVVVTLLVLNALLLTVFGGILGWI